MENKKVTILLIITLVLVAVMLVFTFVTTTIGGNPDIAAANARDSILVYGQGKVSINPDIAYITLGFENLNTDPQKAQDDNAAQIDKIITAVKGAGIPDPDIQTSQYNVFLDYNSDNTIKGYHVTDTIEVTIKDIGKSGSIIKAASDAGANLFYGIRFDIIKRQDAYLQALDLAMSRADEKAKKLASDSGRNIAEVINVQESETVSTPYYQYSQMSNYLPAQAPSNSQASTDTGTIASGQLEISAIVNVTYRLN